MYINYDNLPLSKKELLIFLVTEVGVSLGVGWIFYDNYLIGLALAIGFYPTIKLYKKKLNLKKKHILLMEFNDLLFSLSSDIATGVTMDKAIEQSLEFWKDTYNEDDYIIIELKNMVRKMKELHEKDISCLEDFALRSGLSDVVDFVGAYEVLRSSGADMTKAIEQTSDIIRDKIIMESELRTLMSQKVFESRLVGASPILMVFFLKIASPEYFTVMYLTSGGKAIMTICLVLIGFSLYLIERNNRIEF